MQNKQIVRIITLKMNEWLKTLPATLAEEVKESLIVTGGCIASMLLNEKVNDFDVYINNKETLIKLCKHYMKDILGIRNCLDLPSVFHIDSLEDRSKSYRLGLLGVIANNITPDRVLVLASKEGFKKIDALTYLKPEQSTDYFPSFISYNSINLHKDIQIITRFFGNAAEIHKNFDFVHCTNYFTFKEGLVVNQDALLSLLSKQLKYIGSKYPLTSIIRTKKFLSRGFRINAGQQVKIMLDLNKFDLTDAFTFVDQLAGVDLILFNHLMEKLIEDDIFNSTDVKAEIIFKMKEKLEFLFETYLPHLTLNEEDEEEAENKTV